jgi:ferrochelatase
MEPGTEETIIKLAKDGCNALLMVPISFVSDHIETLEEIDVEYRDLALANGIGCFRRAPSLNDHDDFLQGLAELVQQRWN